MAPSLVFVLVVVVGAIVWKVAMRGRDEARFSVEISGPGIDGVKMRGAVPGRSASDVLDFVARLELPAGAKLWGVPDHGRLRLRFSAGVPEHLQQRLRNFFYN